MLIARKTSIILSLICLAIPTLGQDLGIEVRQHRGFILPHRNGVKNLIKDHVDATEISIERKTVGHKNWHHQWGFPMVGFSVYTASLGNPKELGWTSAFYPYFKFQMAGNERIRSNFRIGSGVGFISKVFDADDNHKNVLVGSHLNIVASLMAEVEIDITKRLSSSLGASFTHYSNGAFKIPNLGINIPSLNLALNYSFGETRDLQPISAQNEFGKYSIIVHGMVGFKENYPVNGPKYGAYNISGELIRRFGSKSQLSAMLDLFYNTSLKPRMIEANIPVNNAFDVMQQGVFVSYQVTVGKLAMLAGQGVYLRTKWKDDTHFYHRIGVIYSLTERVTARWTLKTHFFKADNFEFGLGYRILK